jgi:hypothetical protein
MGPVSGRRDLGMTQCRWLCQNATAFHRRHRTGRVAADSAQVPARASAPTRARNSVGHRVSLSVSTAGTSSLEQPPIRDGFQ